MAFRNSLKMSGFLIFLFFFSISFLPVNGQEEAKPNNIEEIVNSLDELVSEFKLSNIHNENLFWISFWIALAAILGTITSSVIFFMQFRETKKDIGARIRPILARSATSEKRSIILKIDEGEQNPRILIKFRNVGNLPALNIKKKIYVKLQKPGEQIKIFDNLEEKKMASLGPQEDFLVSITLASEEYEQAKSGGNCHYGIKITYSDPKNKKFFYLIEGRYEKGKNKIISSNMN